GVSGRLLRGGGGAAAAPAWRSRGDQRVPRYATLPRPRAAAGESAGGDAALRSGDLSPRAAREAGSHEHGGLAGEPGALSGPPAGRLGGAARAWAQAAAPDGQSGRAGGRGGDHPPLRDWGGQARLPRAAG